MFLLLKKTRFQKMKHYINKKRNPLQNDIPKDAGKINPKTEKIRKNANLHLKKNKYDQIRAALIRGDDTNKIVAVHGVDKISVEKVSMKIRTPNESPKRVTLNVSNKVGSIILRESLLNGETVGKVVEKILLETNRL